jgi:hypothetical protein
MKPLIALILLAATGALGQTISNPPPFKTDYPNRWAQSNTIVKFQFGGDGGGGLGGNGINPYGKIICQDPVNYTHGIYIYNTDHQNQSETSPWDSGDLSGVFGSAGNVESWALGFTDINPSFDSQFTAMFGQVKTAWLTIEQIGLYTKNFYYSSNLTFQVLNPQIWAHFVWVGQRLVPSYYAVRENPNAAKDGNPSIMTPIFGDTVFTRTTFFDKMFLCIWPYLRAWMFCHPTYPDPPLDPPFPMPPGWPAPNPPGWPMTIIFDGPPLPPQPWPPWKNPPIGLFPPIEFPTNKANIIQGSVNLQGPYGDYYEVNRNVSYSSAVGGSTAPWNTVLGFFLDSTNSTPSGNGDSVCVSLPLIENASVAFYTITWSNQLAWPVSGRQVQTIPPGASIMLANQFSRLDGREFLSNSIATVDGVAANGFDADGNAFYATNQNGGAWYSRPMGLRQKFTGDMGGARVVSGTGVQLSNPWTTNVQVITAGFVPSGIYSVGIASNSWQMLSWPFPDATVNLATAGFPMQAGDELHKLNSDGKTFTVYTYAGSSWVPSVPTFSRGQSFWFLNNHTNKTWTCTGASPYRYITFCSDLNTNNGMKVFVNCRLGLNHTVTDSTLGWCPGDTVDICYDSNPTTVGTATIIDGLMDTTNTYTMNNYWTATNTGGEYSFPAVPSGLTQSAWTVPTGLNVTSWLTRIASNGGVLPSVQTVNAANVFELRIAKIKPKIYHCNIIAPDSIIAFRVPLIRTYGNSLWLPVTVGSGGGNHLDVNGFTGYASSLNGTVYDTGIKCSLIPSFGIGNGGLSLYESHANLLGLDEAGALVGALDTGSVKRFTLTILDKTGNSSFRGFDLASQARALNPGSATNGCGGFFSGNRTSSDYNALYYASPNTAFETLASSTVTAVQLPPTTPVAVGGQNLDKTYTVSQQRLSYMSVHDGFNSSEAKIEADAAMELRTALGGGL